MNFIVGGYIRQLRLNQLKGQKDIASRLGISVPAYSKIECGITDIGVSRLQQIADLFGVAPESLVVGKDFVHEMVEENKGLKFKLNEVNDYCILLQRKVIRTYEMLDELKRKYNEDGVIDLTRERVKSG